MISKWAFSALTVVALAISTAHAHHSAALYDLEHKTEIVGTIKSVSFSNPHTKLELATMGADGQSKVWAVESSSSNMLRRRGWVFDKIKVGDKVTIMGAPYKDGTPGMYMLSMKLQSGTIFGRPDDGGDTKGLD